MLNLAINTYVHILFVIVIVVCLVMELTQVKSELTWKQLQRLLRIVGLYGLAAIVVVSTGMLNWFLLGKGEQYYSENVIFLTKFSLFIVVGLLSLYPTIWFFKHKKKYKEDPPEFLHITNASLIRKIITVEIVIMSIIPLLATLMANGIGNL